MMDLKELATRYSTWVVAVITGAAAYWLQLPAQEQAALLASYPWLKQVAPAAGLIAFLVARAAPQTPKE